jgi:anti-sigma B factor antagonist
MKIEATRTGGSAVLRLGGRLDREWAEHLSSTLEDLLQRGVRSLSIDLSDVTYVSSAGTRVLARWQEELAVLRGQLKLTGMAPALREAFTTAGWDSRFDAADESGGPKNLRQSSWQLRASSSTSGRYQMSSCAPQGTLSCRLHGDPNQLTRSPLGPDDCSVVSLPAGAFGLGIGAIGGGHEECRERLGELVAVAGCVAYFPSDGARMADYLVGEGSVAPRVVLGSGLTCEGGFTKLVQFSTQPEVDSISFSELAGVCLEAAGGKVAGLVIAGETTGLSGTRLRQSPGIAPLQFEVPAVRDWLSFAPERTHSVTTAIIAGVVARAPEGPLAAHLRPLGAMGLFGHFHAAVFSYHPLPQRTVELGDLMRGIFTNQQLRDVLHLLWDDRSEGAVGESALLRGVGWVGPITQIS